MAKLTRRLWQEPLAGALTQHGTRGIGRIIRAASFHTVCCGLKHTLALTSRSQGILVGLWKTRFGGYVIEKLELLRRDVMRPERVSFLEN